MPGTCCSVWTTHHHVRMNYRSPLIERDIAAHANQLVLTTDRNLFVHFALRVEPAHRCVIQRSDSDEMRVRDVILLSRLLQPGIDFVALVGDDGILFSRLSGVQQLHLHLGSFARWNGFRRLHIFAWRILRTHHHGGDSNQYQRAAQSFYSAHRFTPKFENFHKSPTRSPCSRTLVSATYKFNSNAGVAWPGQRRRFLPAAP